MYYINSLGMGILYILDAVSDFLNVIYLCSFCRINSSNNTYQRLVNMTVKWILPIKIISEPNTNHHWSVKYKRGKEQKKQIWLAFYNDQPKIRLPCEVTLTRIGPRKLDEDNLIASFKAVRDEIADHLIPGKKPGQADSDFRITWDYKQEPSKNILSKNKYWIKVEILSYGNSGC